MATHGGKKGLTISVKAKPHKMTTAPRRADAAQATFSGDELGSGYSAYRARVTLSWYATKAKPHHNPKVRGKVVTTVPHYALGGGSSAHPVRTSSSSGSCTGALPLVSGVKVTNTSPASMTAPAEPTARISSTWPTAQTATLSLRGPSGSPAAACLNTTSPVNVGSYRVPAMGSTPAAYSSLTAAGYYAWYATIHGKGSCSAAFQVRPADATTPTTPQTISVVDGNSTAVPTGLPASLTASFGSSYAADHAVAVDLIGPASTAAALAANGNCVSGNSVAWRAGSVSISPSGTNLPAYRLTATGADAGAHYYAWRVTDGSKSPTCSVPFQIVKASPTLTVSTAGGYVPGVQSTASVTGLATTVGATAILYRATSAAQALANCATNTGAVASETLSIGNGARTFALSYPIIGHYAVRMSLPETTSSSAYSTCGNAAGEQYHLSLALNVTLPGENATLIEGSALPAGKKVSLHVTFSGYSSAALDGSYVVQIYKYTSSANCSSNAGPDATAKSGGFTTLAPTTVNDSVAAKNAGKYFFRAKIITPANGAQPAVLSNCVGPYTWKS